MIIGWRSPLDNRVYPIDAYDAFEQIIPEPVMRAIAFKDAHDERHSGTNVTITSSLGCPRKMLIHRMLPTTPDPVKMWAMQRGTWLHERMGMGLGENKDWWTEEVDAEACEFKGTLFGIFMSCKVDALKKDYTELLDWKFRSDLAARWVDPQGRAKIEDAAQLNMIRLLIEQTTGEDLQHMKMYAWQMFSPPARTVADVMSEMQIGEVKPGGGKYTIREIFYLIEGAMRTWHEAALAIAAEDGIETDTPNLHAVPEEIKQQIIHELPMVGETMYSRKNAPHINMCSRYCEISEECMACEGGI